MPLSEEAMLLEFPGLEKLAPLEARVEKLEAEVRQTKELAATLLSGLIPGGIIHDRVAEVRAAVKELVGDPGNPHASSARAAIQLSWGQMGVES